MKRSSYQEPACDIPVTGEYDVVVCGGGPAGCVAAWAAALYGARSTRRVQGLARVMDDDA